MKLILSVSIIAALVSCKRDSTLPEGQGSSLSSVTIGKLQTPEDLPQWQKMEVLILKFGTDDVQVSKEIEIGEFSESETIDVDKSQVELKIPYGDYNFQLNYYDSSNEVIYKSCDPDELFSIKTPDFPAPIDVCQNNGDAEAPPVGNTNDALSVSIETEIIASDASISAAGVKAKQLFNTHCVNCHGDASNKPIDADKLVDENENYLPRGLSLLRIDDEANPMPPTPAPSWDTEKAEFKKALECITNKTQTSCQ